MKYLEVNTIFGLIGNGCTEPLSALMSNGKYAIIKKNNNDMGNLVLANEYICYQLAKFFDLPIPNAGIGHISNNTNISNQDLIQSNNYGPCFYSERIDKASKLNKNIIKYLSNKNDFIKVLLFDHIVYNKDRNQGNILVTSDKNESKFFIIDHTHVFKNQTIWDEYCLEQGMNDNDYNDSDILDYNKETYSYFFNTLNIDSSHLKQIATQFKETYSQINIHNLFSCIPTDWSPSAFSLNALNRYLDYRMYNLDQICDNILGKIRR